LAEKIKTLDVIRKYSSRSRQMAEEADSLVKQLDSRQQLQVDVGGFYRTIDHSTVYVAGTVQQCDCDHCKLLRDQKDSPLGDLFTYALGLQKSRNTPTKSNTRLSS